MDKISLIAVYPELILAVMALVITMVDLGVKSPRRTATYALSLLTLGVVSVLLAFEDITDRNAIERQV